MSGWGIEARHSWDDGAIVLGDLDSYPKYRINKMDGLRNLADFDPRAEPASRRGEIPRSSTRGGRTVVYDCTTLAESLAELREAEEALLAAFDPTGERRMTIAPHPDYAIGERYFDARAVSLIGPDEQLASPNAVSGGFERDFVLALRLSDPRVYDAIEQQVASGAVVAALTQRVTNPKGSLNTTGWTNSGMATFARADLPMTDGLPEGIETGFLFTGDAADDRVYTEVAATIGNAYTISVYLLAESLTGGAGIDLQLRRASDAAVSDSTDELLPGGWVRRSITFTAVASENYRVAIRQVGAGTSRGYFTAAMQHAGSTPADFFDGDSPTAAWSGTANASASIRKALHTASVTPDGRIDTDPILRIAGPATNPVLRHRELDRLISLTKTLVAGQTLDIDLATRRVLLNGVIPAPEALQRAVSDWLDEDTPGLRGGELNTIELYGDSTSALSVIYHDAYPA